MTTTADIGYHSSSRIIDETNNSFMLNQSLDRMDIDDHTQDLIVPTSTTINVHSSAEHILENGINGHENKRDVFHQGNLILNKSFDVIPQVKDDKTSLDEHTKTNNVLDTTVELPNNTDVFDEKPTLESNILKPVNNIEISPSIPAFLPNQFSLEYTYELPKREENIQPLSPNSLDTIAGLAKNMKLNGTKTIDGQDPLTPTLTNDKVFDTNTFVLKKKGRKITTPTNENNFSGSIEDTSGESTNKQSPFSTPPISNDGSRFITTNSVVQQSPIDPTRIIECVEQYYRMLHRVCECTEELKQELRLVKNERDQMSEDLINAENAFNDVKKRNEKLKTIINEHKTNTETLKRFSEESVRYTEEQKQKYAILKQHAQEKLNEANGEIERLRRAQGTEMEGIQAQLRYAQLRVQSLEQELKSTKQELEQKKKENIELTNICDELLTTNKRMHSFLSRANTLFAFTITVLAVLTTGVFFSTFFEKYHETVSIEAVKPIVKHMTDFSANRKKTDLGVLQLNVDMDLNPLFDWNVKQLFLYLVAEYVTPANSLNQVVLWDKIIRRGEEARFNFHEIATKYYFWDDGEHLRSNNVTLSLNWNIISNAGRLLHIRANGSTSFIFPAQYTTSRSASARSSSQE
ncbi:hypothetical protein I4U23_023874 [Adineta vaga]|nr:hypothetical protein I4U23_023874 [Adineta vaga]